LEALGIPARVIVLAPRVERFTESGGIHIVVEAFLNDAHKWMMLEPQWDVIPMIRDMPLNAVQLQYALAELPDGLAIRTGSQVSQSAYFHWISPFLSYFVAELDNRIPGTEAPDRSSIRVLLRPLGSPLPPGQKPDDLLCTSAIGAFYVEPVR
jgi:hypothetical protein